MTDCPVCGKGFEEQEDYDSHVEREHSTMNETYKQAFCKGNEQEEDEGWGTPEDTAKDIYDLGHPEEEKPAEEIDQQEDKPVQSHDDWQEDLKQMQDQFSTEEVLRRATEQDDEEGDDNKDEENNSKEEAKEEDSEHPRINISYMDKDGSFKSAKTLNDVTDAYKEDAEEEGGADDPLKKVADLAEAYRYMQKDTRASLFESLGFGQGDSAILSGLEWNELTRPVKVEASEAFAKEEDEEEKPEDGEDPDGNENEAYEALYNIEKNHLTPDYKKKAIACTRCNEAFYNGRDRDVHFNEVHTSAKEYELPEQCPFCKELIQEPETLDYHMQEQHGAHVPSQFTQTGVSAGMADTDFDALEAFDTDWACPRCGNKNVKTKYDENSLPVGRECPKCGLGQESRKRATEGQGGTYGRDNYMLNPQHEDITTCVVCGRGIDSHANPNTDYRGMNGDAPATDHYFLGGDQGGSDDKYDFESYAGENELDLCPICQDGMKCKSLMSHGANWNTENNWHTNGLTPPNADESFATENHPVGEPWQATNHNGETFEYVNELDEDGVGTHITTIRFVGYMDPEGASESRASDLRSQIKKKEKFINMASFENPLNMGDDQAQLEDMKAELASLGESILGKEFGDYEVDCDCDKDPNCKTCGGKGTNTWTSSVYQGDEDAGSDMRRQKDILDRSEDYDPTLELKSGYPWQEGEEGGGHQDLDDTTEYVDDSDNWEVDEDGVIKKKKKKDGEHNDSK